MAKITKIYKKVETKSCKHITSVEMEIAKSDDNKYIILSTFGSSSSQGKLLKLFILIRKQHLS